MEIGTAWCCTGKHFPQCLWDSRILDSKSVNELPSNVTICNIKMSYPRSSHSLWVFSSKHQRSQVFSKTYNLPVGVEESSETQTEADPSNEEIASEDSPKELFAKPMSSDELKALSADSERAKLIRKLSEANQQNRFLKRQLQLKEDALVNFKSELAVMELEVQALVALAEETAQSGIQEGSRKINGKYIQSHLLSRLEAVHGKLKEQIKDVDAVQSREVPLFWCGMAESVQVMGSFDGWSQGEHLSPEYDGSFTKFTTKLLLRPGRYEIKFLVDGMWQLSPEYATVGEGPTKNNLLVVE